MENDFKEWRRRMIEKHEARPIIKIFKAMERSQRGGARINGGDILRDFAPAKEAAERIASNGGGSRSQPKLTAWQQMGAAIQFRAKDEGNTLLGEIAKSNLAIAKNTDPKANKINKPALMDGNFGAYQ